MTPTPILKRLANSYEAHRLGICTRGHAMTPENTQSIGSAGLRCKECRRRIARESVRRRRAFRKANQEDAG